MSELISIERDGAVQIIRLNRPDKKNALTREMYSSMSQALQSGDADEQIRVHVILGQPGAFSAGNDMQDFMNAALSQGSLGTEIIEFLHALAKTAKPLISGVDGLAIGIGTTLHLHCDLTFATPRSVFRTPFVDLGLVPEAGSSLLGPKIMGYQRAFALLALGESFSAEQACQAGMVYRVVSEEELEATVLQTAQTLASRPPLALKLTRDLLRSDNELQTDTLAQRIDREALLFSQRLKSAETAQAVSAFLSRKK